MTAIEVSSIGKDYWLGEREPYKLFKDAIVNAIKPRKPRQFIHALENITFNVEPGETVGIIGRNGAGKSTLLKILSRITSPTTGTIEIEGRVGSLLEVGTGFHPELTGRENIFFNGALLGMNRREIQQRYASIVEFAELEQFIDTPVKRYSSGMYVRLAFAVAAHMDTEILLVDEVLAVGDASFQKKCLGRMHDISECGKTILFVSHDMNSIRNICERAIWIKDGKINLDGEAANVTTAYLKESLKLNGCFNLEAALNKLPDDPAISLTNIEIKQQGISTSLIMSGEPIEVEITYLVKEKTHGLKIFLDVIDERGTVIMRTYCGTSKGSIDIGTYTSTLLIPPDLFAHRDYEFVVGALIWNTRTCTGHTAEGVHIPVHVELSRPTGHEIALQYRPLVEPNFTWRTRCVG